MYPKAAGLIVFGLLLLFLVASPVAATPQTINLSFSGQIVGGDNPLYTVKSNASFSFDNDCDGTTSSFCTLTITLSADITGSGEAPSQGEVLTALVFDVLGGADFRDGPPGNKPFAGATVGASALVGSGNVIALGDLGTIGGLENISGHWGLNPAIIVPGQGSHAPSSVGDLFNGAATLDTF